MIVSNWMQPEPITIASDLLLSEAKRILTENNLHALPVVDAGVLRGLVTRNDCLRVAQFVAATQNADEFSFFANRLRVRDVMVRRPATVQMTDTMEHVLEKGRELRIGQFPVMDGDDVVGIISANEIFNLAAHFLGAWERRSGITIGPLLHEPGILGRIIDLVEKAGADVHAIYPIGCVEPHPAPSQRECKVIVRFHAPDFAAVSAALEAAGFHILEAVQGQPQHAADQAANG